jgi:hypothetical protein
MAMGLGCTDSVGEGAALPSHVGGTGELLVVLDHPDAEATQALIDSIRVVFEHPYDVLPQLEPSFDVMILPRAEFDRFWKPHRNVLDVVIADRVDTQEPSVKMIRNKYARGQVYIRAMSKSPRELAALISKRAYEMREALHAAELERFEDLHSLDANDVIANRLRQEWGLALQVPSDVRWAKSGKDFVWLDRQLTRLKGGDNHDVQQGLFIYTEPYTAEDQLSMQARLDRRNEVLMKQVPGPTSGSFMTTEMRYFPTYEEVDFKGAFASELRGLWRMENDYMGGPFFSLTVPDLARKRLVTVEGYAYAPFFDKRDYIREVEAMVKSLVLLPEGAAQSADNP